MVGFIVVGPIVGVWLVDGEAVVCGQMGNSDPPVCSVVGLALWFVTTLGVTVVLETVVGAKVVVVVLEVVVGALVVVLVVVVMVVVVFVVVVLVVVVVVVGFVVVLFVVKCVTV